MHTHNPDFLSTSNPPIPTPTLCCFRDETHDKKPPTPAKPSTKYSPPPPIVSKVVRNLIEELMAHTPPLEGDDTIGDDIKKDLEELFNDPKKKGLYNLGTSISAEMAIARYNMMKMMLLKQLDKT